MRHRVIRTAAAVTVVTSFAVPAAASAAPRTIADRMVTIARAELNAGHAETPLGSNDGPSIDRYRSAVRHSVPGTPWSGYFVSYVARKAGQPLGKHGEGHGSVLGILDWARDEKLVRRTPRRGDLALNDRTVGVVVSVQRKDGRVVGVTTIQGNRNNRVQRSSANVSEFSAYVRLPSKK